VNHTASTNGRILTRVIWLKPYNATSMVNNATPMSKPSQVDQIAERVERLLVRYAELQRTNVLLAKQVDALSSERDSLKSRLSAARARVDALLERLPENTKSKETP
jgi:ABC-type phosphate transport system auxiliary subunit